MNRLLLLSLILALADLHAAKPQNGQAERLSPNVILFLVDDMGWMDSTPYGSKYYVTPNMERLARQSLRFTSAYAMPLCSPTRASLLSGQHSARHGMTTAGGHTPPQEARLPETAPANRALLMPSSKTFLDPAQYTLAEALRDAGYRTGHFGKWHCGLTRAHWPEANGFDVAFHCEPSAGPPNAYFSPYGVVAPGTERPKGAAGRKFITGTITDGPEGEYITDRVTDEALKFIADGREKPFFLNLWHYGVHGPWGHKEEITAEMAKRTDPRGEQDNPVMASMLKSVDESLGRILDRLDELGIADNTILIFMSDNGGNTHSMTETDRKANRDNTSDPTVARYRKWAAFKPPTNNAPLRDGKASLYEGGTRVPLMVRWPGTVKAGSVSDEVVGCIDIYPTVLDALGLRPNPAQKLDGVSFTSVLRGSGPLKREAYFTWFPHLLPGVSVRKGDWKLIRRFEARADKYEGVHELFNLREDLGEKMNLAGKMPGKVKELDALIDGFVRDTGALYPRPNPDYQARPEVPGKPAKATKDPAFGLVPKFCRTSLVEGALRVDADGRTPFLGTAQVKLAGPLTLTLRARSAAGGEGMVRWKKPDQEEFPGDGQAAAFKISPGNQWQDIPVELPVQGRTAIVRLYLPAGSSPVELQLIRFEDKKGTAKTWDFKTAKP
jgi:arylsulfatase A-like enzyme